MARFAHYIQIYRSTYVPDLFVDDPEIGCKNEWPRRQEILGRYFETDSSIVFKPVEDRVDEKTGEVKMGTTYPHRVWHSRLNPNIIVLRLANVKDLIIEQDFEERHLEHNPSCYVIWDNRGGCRRVLIQKLRTSFNSTNQVASIVSEVLNKHLKDGKHEFDIELRAQRYPMDFYKLWEVQKNVTQSLRFNVSDSIVRDGTEAEYLLSIEEYSRTNDVSTVVELKSKTKGQALRVNVTGDYVRSLVHASAGSASTIELYTLDGALFECYIDSDLETEDKIVSSDFPVEYLDNLFSNDEGVRNAAEEKLVEYLNGCKADDHDIEHKVW